jgi:hypothetical protein
MLRPERPWRSADEDPSAAAEKLFQEDPGFFDSWERAASFVADREVFPCAIEVQAATELVDLTADSLTVGLAWDGASVLEAMPRQIQAGQITKFDVPAQKGDRLEVWVSGFDKFGSARVLAPDVADRRETERRESTKPPDPFDPEDLTTKIVTALALVAVIAGIVLFARSQGGGGGA